MNELKNRIKAPTPKFWKKVRRISLIVAGIGTTLAALPVALPVGLAAVSTYLIVGGTVGASLAQLTKEDTPETENLQP